jgi:hypothetical protein
VEGFKRIGFCIKMKVPFDLGVFGLGRHVGVVVLKGVRVFVEIRRIVFHFQMLQLKL